MSTQEAQASAAGQSGAGRPNADQTSAGQPGAGQTNGDKTSGGQTSAGQPGGGQPGPGGQPTEAEMRAAYEAEMSRITSADMVLQATVSLLNIGARRLGLVGPPEGAPGQPPERDLEQVRDAIDAVRGLMPVVERRAPQEARPLRDALSQLQMAYAREAQGAPGATAQTGTPSGAPGSGPQSTPPAGTPAAGRPATPQPAGKPGAGPAESSGRLWVPGR